MSCGEIQPELVGFHFGELSAATRSAVEAHLVSCGSCLADFLALKRAIETATGEARPSEAARRRLRDAVAAEVAPEPAPRRWSWWERPTAFLFAGATVAVALLLSQIVSTGPGSMPRSLDEAPALIDRAP
jgi:anti-sigma factor RsiW